MSRWILDLHVKDRYKRLMKTMLCSCGNESTDCGPIIDIDQILQDYAWRELKRDARWYQSPLLRRSYYEIEIPWNFYEFTHKTVKFTLRNNNHLSSDGFKNRKHVELFSTQYENNTAKEQVYNLKTNRQTQARTFVSFQKGFSIKGKASFTIDIPERFGHCGVTASASGKLKVTKTRGETLEEMFTWQVDSDITVDPFHVTNVKLVVTEDEFMADFEVKTTMRMPTGEAPIILKRKRDNHIQAVLLISDLHDAFSDLSNSVVNFVKTDAVGGSKAVVEFITTGILDSVRWRDQRITIESKPISQSITEAADLLYDIPLYAKDIYSQVIKHATKEKENKMDAREHQSQGASAPYPKMAEGCVKTFSRKDRLLIHIRTHTGERPYVCECGKSYARSSHLARHKETAHISVVTVNSLVCEIDGCNQTFATKQSLSKHIKRRHDQKLYECTFEGCNRSFHKHQHLTIHEYEHTQVKPFQCTYENCRKCFMLPSKLKQHMKVHIGYRCDHDGCDATFDKWTSLRKHKYLQHPSIHTCTECDKTFTQKNALQQHLKSHSEEREVFPCPRPNCGRTYLEQKNLTAHIKSYHDGHRFHCDFEGCDRSFSTKQKCQKHVLLHQMKGPVPKKKSRKGIRKKSYAASVTGIDPKLTKCDSVEDMIHLSEVEIAKDKEKSICLDLSDISGHNSVILTLESHSKCDRSLNARSLPELSEGENNVQLNKLQFELDMSGSSSSSLFCMETNADNIDDDIKLTIDGHDRSNHTDSSQCYDKINDSGTLPQLNEELNSNIIDSAMTDTCFKAKFCILDAASNNNDDLYHRTLFL